MHISMATLLYNVEKNVWIEYEFYKIYGWIESLYYIDC
jgi:hypothetical protein